MDRQLGLDKSVFKRSNAVLTKALRDGKQLTRKELEPILRKGSVDTEGLSMGHLLIHAELDGIICSGGRRGKQFTYALLEERAPQAKTLEREAALAELAKRYFRSHGPATLQDFVWWSGLTMTDAREGVAALSSQLEKEVVENQTYWFIPSIPVESPSPSAYLLSNYDEYTVGYTDRRAIFDEDYTDKLDSRESILVQTILIEGEVVGIWKRTLKKSEVVLELSPFFLLKKAEAKAVRAAAERYGRFLGLPVVVG
jgi:hypothetical protein